MDRVRPLKFESTVTGGSSNDYLPTETNPQQDFVACKGIALEDSATHTIEKTGNNAGYSDPDSGLKTFKSLKSLDLTFFDSGLPYLKETSNTFTLMSRFVWRGTSQLSSPTLVRAIAFMKDAGQTGEVRLYDFTNSVVLGTAQFTGQAAQLVTIPTSGWSTAASIVEFQLRSLTGGKESRISSLSLEW